MCGRYAASKDADTLVEMFAVEEVVEVPAPSWNVAPTDQVAAVVERTDEESGSVTRKLVAPRWGLVPSWSKEANSGARMINARVETVATKPAFRRPFAMRRCLLPADGYYEWYTTQDESRAKPVKQPFFIHRADGGSLAMAGIYEFWKDPADGSWLTTCSVITTTATDAVGHIHDRMPMVVPAPQWSAWLDPALTDPDAALALLTVTGPADLEAYAVSKLVSNVRNNGPELVAPLAEDER